MSSTSTNSLLPVESPLAMPEQSLRTGKLKNRSLPTSPRHIGWRRFYVFGGGAVMTIGAAWLLMRVLRVGGMSLLDTLLLFLFLFLFAWIAFSFLSTLAGFVLVLTRGGHKLGIDTRLPQRRVGQRTALLMPTYNEDPRRLLAGLQAIYESVAETGQLDRFDFFVLSDTRREEIAVREMAEFLKLRERLGGETVRLYYRRRTDNTGRKAGNIAEWVRRFGGAYPHMLILDADSLMTGDSIIRLAAAMERNPEVGLIQTLPMVVNGSTLFARMQQFGGHIYGPVMAQGVAWWQGAESNYWGHNAIIRTRAFAEEAGLPPLSGHKPFGGHILSHDFVEAALMRRGGWAIHMVPTLRGSYEEGPPSLTDLLIRDRRWCQGNLQHAKVLFAKGLHWISRCHMLIGIGGYLTAPMWAMLLLFGLMIPLENSGLLSGGFNLPGVSPVSFWRARDATRVAWLFIVTMGLLFTPKILGYIAILLNSRERRRSGGGMRVFIGILIESVLATLMAPIVMYRQSRGVAEVIAGKDSGWEAQRRDDGSLPLSGLIRSYGGLTLFGLFIGVLAWNIAPSLLAWMSPIVLGMALSIPVVGLTSARRSGDWLRRRRLLCIPEELDPPPILRRAAELRQRFTAEAKSGPPQA